MCLDSIMDFIWSLLFMFVNLINLDKEFLFCATFFKFPYIKEEVHLFLEKNVMWLINLFWNTINLQPILNFLLSWVRCFEINFSGVLYQPSFRRYKTGRNRLNYTSPLHFYLLTLGYGF